MLCMTERGIRHGKPSDVRVMHSMTYGTLQARRLHHNDAKSGHRQEIGFRLYAVYETL